MSRYFCRLFGCKCAGCGGIIPETDVVRRAHENIYHTQCFSCVQCHAPLQTGDQFYLRFDHKLLCRADYKTATISAFNGRDYGVCLSVCLSEILGFHVELNEGVPVCNTTLQLCLRRSNLFVLNKL
jgi:hypothetical protein